MRLITFKMKRPTEIKPIGRREPHCLLLSKTGGTAVSGDTYSPTPIAIAVGKAGRSA